MKKLILATGVTLALLSCKQEVRVPSVAETLQSYTIEQMMDNENVGGGSFSPDKSKLLVHSNRSGIYNLYTVPATGGEFSAQPVASTVVPAGVPGQLSAPSSTPSLSSSGSQASPMPSPSVSV